MRALALLGLAGCFDPTEIVVTVDTTFGVPCTIDSLHIEATTSAGTVTADYAVTDADLPGSITLSPDGDRGDISVKVIGMRAGEPFATAEAQVAFDRNVSEELRFVLDRSCVPGPCPAVGSGGFADLPPKLARRGCGALGYQLAETLFELRDACDMQQPLMGRVLANADEREEVLLEPLPFPVTLYGKPMTKLWAGTNGYVAFSADEPHALAMDVGAPRSLGDVGFPTAGILPFWDDLQTGLRGVCFAVTGEFPDRVLWITWREACFAAAGSMCGVSAAQGSLTFGAAIEETTDIIYLGYFLMTATSGRAKGLTATIGITDDVPRGCPASECGSDGTCASGVPCGYTQVSSQQNGVLSTVELVPR